MREHICDTIQGMWARRTDLSTQNSAKGDAEASVVLAALWNTGSTRDPARDSALTSLFAKLLRDVHPMSARQLAEDGGESLLPSSCVTRQHLQRLQVRGGRVGF